MDETPTDDEMADTFNSLMSLSERYSMLYGTPRRTINKVLRFWGKLGLRHLETEAESGKATEQTK